MRAKKAASSWDTSIVSVHTAEQIISMVTI